MPLTANAALSKDKQSGKSVTLQHRHFAFIASVISDLGFLSLEDKRAVANTFASELQVTNRNFDWDRFLRACNLLEGQ